MPNYKQVGYGSQGDDVRNLQKMLNGNGYNLAVDGIFGSKTQAAVKDYQKKNNLAVDGIVGTNTWGALTKASTQAKTNIAVKPAANTPNTVQAVQNTAKPTTPTFQYQPYKESDTVLQAQQMLQQQMAQKPGAYQSQWQDQLNGIIDKIMNREQFSYDLNGDALYQQYKDMYMLQGQQAMMDTMGQAQAMTGGYGNSYAQTAGQQAYNGYLQGLNDVVPELYQMALSKYQSEGQEMFDQYGLLADQEQQDYGRYQDDVSAWNAEMERLLNQYYTERDFDYGQWADGRDFGYGQYIDDRNYQYQVDRDAVADKQWQDSFDYQKDRDAVADKQWQDSFQYQQDRDKVSDQQWLDSFNYQKDRDQVSDKQWQDSFNYQKDRDKVSDEQWQKEYEEAIRQWNQKNGISTGSTGGNGGNTTTENPSTEPDTDPGTNYVPYNNGGLSTEEIKAIQKTLGLTVDGKWGPKSEAAAKAMWGVTSAKDAQAKLNSMKTNSGGGSFNGSTYNEAVDYMKKNGVSSANASGVMTQSEWNRRKSSLQLHGTGGAEVRNYSTYKEYLKDYVQYQMEKK